jgi:hypothetical protein
VSHPSLGLPPRDLTAGHPSAAATLRGAAARIGPRTLETAIDLDPTMRERYTDLELRSLLADVPAFLDRLATSVAADDPSVLAHFAEMVAPRYRKRRVPMDDVVTLCEGLRRAASAVAEPVSLVSLDAAIDEAIAVFRWHRRLGGDARKRNPFLAFIYKGA